jgi:chitodextrinase
VIAQTMQPDYMSVLEEPDTEATMSGQTEVGTVAGATSMLTQILASLQTAAVPGMKVGAGVGSWLPDFQDFIQNFVALPVDFIDMHVLTVNDSFLPNALTIASMAASAGKPLTMTQTWLRKVRDDELGVLSPSVLMARDPFSFWAPLDTYFLQTMEKLAYTTQMTFISAAEPIFFWAYVPYNAANALLTPAQMMTQANQVSNTNMLAASFTSSGMGYHSSILSSPDTAPPSTPVNVAGTSGQPTTASVTWNASTDNVGVAGYYVFRTGVKVGTTAQTFYEDTAVTDGTTYSYFVKAFDLAGNVSAPSLTISVTTWNTIPPTAPTNVAGTVVSTEQINLTWSASTDKVAIGSYRVFRGTSATSLTQVATTYSTPTSYINYPLTPATKYYFGVEAVDTDGNVSPMSAAISVTTMGPPSAPVKLTAKATSSEEVALTWSAGSSGMPIGAYDIFRGTSRTNLVQVATRTTTTFNDYPLTPGTTYYYAVEETAGGSVSPMSAIVSATTP